MSNGIRRLVCPDCTKRGVTLRRAREDHWGCRYCDWFAFHRSPDDTDIKEIKRLREVNPGHDNELPIENEWSL